MNFNPLNESDFQMITLSTCLTAVHDIEITFINLLTQDSKIFELIKTKLKNDNYYQPGMSKKKLQIDEYNQFMNLNIRYGAFSKIPEYFISKNPITFLINEFTEESLMNLKE